MIVVKFSVNNQRLRKITSAIIPSNIYKKLKFEFDFRTEDWGTVETKTANFSYNGRNYAVELEGIAADTHFYKLTEEIDNQLQKAVSFLID